MEDKPLHGMYPHQIEEVADIKKTYQCLEKAGLTDSTEALIMVAQEQALSTRAIEDRIGSNQIKSNQFYLYSPKSQITNLSQGALQSVQNTTPSVLNSATTKKPF